MVPKLLWICSCVFLISSSFAQLIEDDDEEEGSICHTLTAANYTCSQCIQLHPSCAWCPDANFDNDNDPSPGGVRLQRRCNTPERLRALGCDESNGGKIEYRETSDREIRADPPRDPLRADGSDAIQISPQLLEVVLRPKDATNLTLTFRQSENYPVDLYYLMDLSLSMEDDRNNLVKLSQALARQMEILTRNFRMGFGSFVDKPTIPFIDARIGMKNCGDDCVPPYSFVNGLKLDNDINRFREKVRAAKTSKNLDSPEGGFDAMMQALQCEDEIGWRDNSRRMIVFSTDATFHTAGDGRLAGIVTPNDMRCHLRGGNEYTKSLEYDYPSVSQIHAALKEKKANVIFAVTEDLNSNYNHLKDALPEVSASVGTLDKNSSNIVKLIVDNYNAIAEKITLTDNTTTNLKVTYFSKCLGNTLEETNECDGIKLGKQVKWTINLEALSCDGPTDFDLDIHPVGLSERLKIRIKIVCGCDCEKQQPIPGGKCQNGGASVCGVCKCPEGYRGRKCQCKDKKDGGDKDLEDQCRQNKLDPTAPLCNGLGACVCGECVCNARPDGRVITGQFCQCDNLNCPRKNGLICNDHGKCSCGKCSCEKGWSGFACECNDDDTPCMGPDGQKCSGRGECVCGECRCAPNAAGQDVFSGPLCNECPSCPPVCELIKDCVECQMFLTGKHKGEKVCEENCKKVKPLADGQLREQKYIFTVINVPELPEGNHTEYCQAIDEKGCTFYYSYKEVSPGMTGLEVHGKRKRECPPPLPVLAIVLGVIAGIVIIGILLLLLWKILTVLADRREFANFLTESKNAKFDTGENPIFHPATSTFKNPAYGGKNL